MFKMLLASTALTALVTTSAFAQTAPATTDTNATTTTETNAATGTNAMPDATGAMHGPTLASDLIGASVYESSAQDAASIGEINDIVVSPEGEVSSVVIGVGGFLGIGEKDVEVEYGAVEWADRDGQRWIVANMTREQLEAAPAFDRTNVYTEAQSQPEGVNATQNMATGTDPNVATGTGTSAVAPAEQQTQVIDRMTMTQVTPTDITADDLTGRTVYGSSDENIGEVGEVLISTDNKIEGFVLNVGGFLGMGEKEVAISPENLDIRADADGGLTVFTPFTKEQLEAQPEYSEESWNADRDSVIMMAPAG